MAKKSAATKSDHAVFVPLTAREIPDEQIARKLV